MSHPTHKMTNGHNQFPRLEHWGPILIPQFLSKVNKMLKTTSQVENLTSHRTCFSFSSVLKVLWTSKQGDKRCHVNAPQERGHCLLKTGKNTAQIQHKKWLYNARGDKPLHYISMCKSKEPLTHNARLLIYSFSFSKYFALSHIQMQSPPPFFFLDVAKFKSHFRLFPIPIAFSIWKLWLYHWKFEIPTPPFHFSFFWF